MKLKDNFFKGLWKENPVLRLVLGLCPTLAVTTSVDNAIGMGLSVIFVLTMSNIVVSSIRKIVPDKMRIPVFIVVIATFVTLVDLVTKAYFYYLNKSLGVFVPLIVVNCIILGRAEAFASKNKVFDSLVDGLGMGIGFTLALVVIATIREVLGNGTIMGKVVVLGSWFPKIIFFILPPGAFVTLGTVLGIMNYLERRRKQNVS